MNVNRVRELRNMAATLRSETVLTPDGAVPKSITTLESVIEKTPSEEVDDVFGVLIDECVRASRFDLELRFRKRLVQMRPNDVLPMCSLAECLSRGPLRDSQAANECAAEAVLIARREDEYVRYALTTQLRVALSNSDYNRVSSAMRELVADAGSERENDYVFERDFIAALDRSKIDPELLAAYTKLSSPSS